MSCILALAQISIADKHINYGESRSAHTVQAVTQKNEFISVFLIFIVLE